MASIVDYILIQKATLQGIANAIRKKKGSTGVIKVVDMANEISTIQGTSTSRGSCAIHVGDTFSYNYGANKDLKVYCPSCIGYTDNGSEFVFTAASAGSGTVTVMSGSITLLVYSVTVTDLASACNHTSFKTEITTPSLCSRTGVKTHTCNTCQTTWTEAIPRLEHSWSDPYLSDAFSSGYGRRCEECGELEELTCPHVATTEKITKYATCYHTGMKSLVCNECGAVVSTETIQKAPHSWSEVVADEDRFSQGWGRYCLVSACGATEEDVECPHKESTSEITKVATCTSTGTRTFTCKVCKTTTGTETLPQLPHTWSESYESSEFVNGYGRKCLVCGALDNSIACPHTSSTPKVTKAATCTATGTRTYYCDACGTVTKTETIQREPHNYVSVVTAPTCTTEGYTTHKCSVCGSSYTDTVTGALGHSWSGWTTTVEPTCVVDGTEIRTCTRCGTTDSRSIEALGHNTTYHEGLAATCTTAGYKGYNQCTVCGVIVNGKETIFPLGHKEVVDKAVAATCTETGLTEGKHCSVCGEVLVKQTVVPALGHSYKEVVTEATCTEGGYTTYTCVRCGVSHKGDNTDPNGHNFIGGWITVKEPTCTEGGKEKRICLTCGYTEYRDVDALGHDYEFDYTVDATCDEGGYDVYTCTRCDDYYTDNETDPNGHNFLNGWVTDVEPTCTTGGTESRTCLNCGYIESRDIDPYGHDYQLISDSSQSSGASMECTRCGDKYEADYDCAILGHETNDGEYDMPDGSTAFKCKHCGVFYPAN